MIAGAICEETDCTGLILVLLAVMAAAAIVLAVVVGAWMATVSTVLERRGWSPAKRRTTAGVYSGVVVVLFWAFATGVPGVAALIVPPVAIAAVPVAVWQRRVTRRCRSAPTAPAP